MNEAEEWEKFRRGSRDAFRNIYRRFAGVLYNYGTRFTGDTGLVEDNIQDLFVDLWESRGRLGPTTSIKYYLFRALRRRIARQSEIMRRFGDAPGDGLSEAGESYEFQLILEQENAARKRILQEVLDGLSARQREILHLKYYEELSFEEIARLMQIDIRSAYKLTYKALASVRTRLAGTNAAVLIAVLLSAWLVLAVSLTAAVL